MSLFVMFDVDADGDGRLLLGTDHRVIGLDDTLREDEGTSAYTCVVHTPDGHVIPIGLTNGHH